MQKGRFFLFPRGKNVKFSQDLVSGKMVTRVDEKVCILIRISLGSNRLPLAAACPGQAALRENHSSRPVSRSLAPTVIFGRNGIEESFAETPHSV
jgi:hypothetical protein